MQVLHSQALRNARFTELGTAFSNLARSVGISVKVCSSDDLPNFSKLPINDQEAAIRRLTIYPDLCDILSQDPGLPCLLEEKKLLWLALKKLRLLPGSDLMDLLTIDDLIEVYVGNRQVYRTFNYYDLCSYSLEELETVPWDQLFFRSDSSILQKLLAEVEQMLTHRKIVKSAASVHTVYETNSPLMKSFSYQLKYLAPLTDQETHRNDCFLAVLTAQPSLERYESSHFGLRLNPGLHESLC
jgi:hypothetical protein